MSNSNQALSSIAKHLQVKLQSSINLSNKPIGTIIDQEAQSPYIKKIEVYDSTEDVLALSCAWLRNRSDPKYSVASLRDPQLYKLITEADRMHAQEIRTYYQRKIMMLKLAGKKLSKFRTDLERFVQETGYRYLDTDTGLAYYLPRFYEYDIELDSLRDEYVDSSEVLTGQTRAERITVSTVSVLHKHRKHFNAKEFWFKLQDRGVLLRHCVQISNPLLSMFESVVQSTSELQMLCWYTPREQDGFKYYGISKIESIKF